MNRTTTKLSLQEFLALPASNERYELAEGRLQPKMSPKYKHASLQGLLYQLIDDWCEQHQYGRVCPEWGVVLQRQAENWVPVPDLTSVSFKRLPVVWEKDEPCPVVPELVIKIISPGQTFGELTEKATDCLLAGVGCVWVVDIKAQSVTIVHRDELPQTMKADGFVSDSLLPELVLPVTRFFGKTPR